MNRNWIRRIVGGVSFTSALFIFQACYGTPQDFGRDVFVEGQVKSKTSGLPIKGITVLVLNTNQFQMTNEEGRFSLYTMSNDSLRFRFADTDPNNKGFFAAKDTVLDSKQTNVYLDILMEEK